MRFYRVAHVANRAGRAREMVDDIHVKIYAVNDILAQEREALVAMQMLYIAFTAGNEIVDRDDVMAVSEKAVAQVGPDETRAA